MKLEFFQRKFWTASRQVYFKFSLSLNPQQLSNSSDDDLQFFCRKQNYCKQTTYLKYIMASSSDLHSSSSSPRRELSGQNQLLDPIFMEARKLLILGPCIEGVTLLA